MTKSRNVWISIGVGASSVALLAASVGVAQAQGENGSKSQRGPVSSLIEDNTISSTQAEAIKSALESARTANRDKVLTALVADGTITQAQADSLASETGKLNKAMRELVQGLDSATAQKIRSALEESREAAMTSVLATLVSAGTITQEQADAVIANKPGKSMGNKGQGGKGQQGKGQQSLGGKANPLVANGTITEEQAKAVHSALDAARDSAQTAVLSQLVTEGVITQSQADAIEANKPKGNRPEGKGSGMKGRGHGENGQRGSANQGATGPQA